MNNLFPDKEKIGRGWGQGEKSMEKPQLSKITANRSSLEPTNTTQRQVILNSLWSDAEWLNTQIHKKRISRSPHRLKMIKAKAYICSILLSGLKDQELEYLNARLKVLEEKASKGVFLP